MSVCRLCNGDDQIVDLFHPQLEKADRLRYYILLATGIQVTENNDISKMVCHRCCEIAVKLYQYRANAVGNDKQLHEKLGIPYIPPVTDQQELQRLCLQILQKGCSSTNTTSKLPDTLELLQDTFDTSNSVGTKPSDNAPELKPTLEPIKHASIVDLQKKYPNLVLPLNSYQSDVAPVVTLNDNEVLEWHKIKLKRFKMKLSSAHISIKKVIEESQMDIISIEDDVIPLESCKDNSAKASPIDKELSENVTNIPKSIILNKPGPKSTKKLSVKFKAAPPRPIQHCNTEVIVVDVNHDEVPKENIPIEIEDKNADNSNKLKRASSNVPDLNVLPIKKIHLASSDKLLTHIIADNTKPLPISTQTNVLQELVESKSSGVPSKTSLDNKTETYKPSSFPPFYACDLCSTKFKYQKSLERHKNGACAIRSTKAQPILELDTVDTSRTVANQYLTTSKPGSGDKSGPGPNIKTSGIVTISDSDDDDDTKFPVKMHMLSKKQFTEEEAISVLFDKHNNLRLDNQTQTFVPKPRNIKYLNSNLICLASLYNELSIYKIQVHFEASSKINAKFKYEHAIPPQKVMADWSNVAPVTIRKTPICSTSVQPSAVLAKNPTSKTHQLPILLTKSISSINSLARYEKLHPLRMTKPTNSYINKRLQVDKKSVTNSKKNSTSNPQPISKTPSIISGIVAQQISTSSSADTLRSISNSPMKNVPMVLNQMSTALKSPTIVTKEYPQLVRSAKPMTIQRVFKNPTKPATLPSRQTILNGQINLSNTIQNQNDELVQKGGILKNIIIMSAEEDKGPCTNGTAYKVTLHEPELEMSSTRSTTLVLHKEQPDSLTSSSLSNDGSGDPNKSLIRVKAPWQLY